MICKIASNKKNKVFYLPQGSHGDDGVPKRCWNGIECGLLDILLTVKHDCGEDNDGHRQAEHEEAQLWGAALQGVAKYSESLGVSGELENAEHSEHAECHEGATDFAIVGHEEADVVGHDRHEVYHWHHRPCELPPGTQKFN